MFYFWLHVFHTPPVLVCVAIFRYQGSNKLTLLVKLHEENHIYLPSIALKHCTGQPPNPFLPVFSFQLKWQLPLFIVISINNWPQLNQKVAVFTFLGANTFHPLINLKKSQIQLPWGKHFSPIGHLFLS